MRNSLLIERNRCSRPLVSGALFAATILCTCMNNPNAISTHETTWQGACLLDSVTAAIIGWEYDWDNPNTDWSSATTSNCVQKLYTYSFVDSILTETAVLESGEDSWITDGGVYYSEPWLYYGTNHAGNACSALRNLKTGETIYITGPGSNVPLCLSKSARYVGYSSGSPKVYDVLNGQVLSLGKGRQPFFIDETERAAWVLGIYYKPDTTDRMFTYMLDSVSPTEVYEFPRPTRFVHLTNMNRSVMAFEYNSRTTNQGRYVVSSLGGFLYGKLDYLEVTNVTPSTDIHLITGNYVYERLGCIHKGNILDSSSSTAICCEHSQGR